jgi:two-component system, NarL family, nitrate/nitrite response regulator NarL
MDGMVLRCLLVDDSVHYLAAARSLLQRAGFQVDVASNGAEAVARAELSHPDVVLLDIDLGGESGFDIARLLRAHTAGGDNGAAGPRIILISTHDQDDFADLIAASPVHGFLAKSALSAAAVEDLLRRPGAGD